MKIITKLLSNIKSKVSKLFTSNKVNIDNIKSVTVGERDERGFADVYVNGEKTNCKMLVFTPEQIAAFEKIEADYNKSKSKNIANQIKAKHDKDKFEEIEIYLDNEDEDKLDEPIKRRYKIDEIFSIEWSEN
jgi:5,10-methylene-tetrahydrofolate dehydrogenase/methenyl tetrahydrofolate cyclohydrolase